MRVYVMRRFFLLVFVIATGSSALFAQERYYRHVVKKGETVYRLSATYGVDAEKIMSKNPGLTPETLKTGMEVLIPVEEHTGGIAGSDCRTMHKIQKKETLWSISQHYGVTVDALLAANPDLDGPEDKLKKGKFLCVPYAKSAAVVKKNAPQGYKSLHIAVVLPLLSKSVEAERCVEFYRGFLMAVSKMKKKGIDINVSAYDEPQAAAAASALFRRISQENPQLVIGPLYPSHFDEMADNIGNKKDTKWLIPFSSKYQDIGVMPNVYLLNAPDVEKSRFVATLVPRAFSNVKAVFLHSANGNEKPFSSHLYTILKDAGCEVADLRAGYTVEQMQQTLTPGKRILFIPDASSVAGANDVLEKVVKLRGVAALDSFSVMGYPEWTEGTGVSADYLHAADTYVFTNAFYNSYAKDTQRIAEDYRTWFRVPMLNVSPRMALLGYDAGISLMNGLKDYGKDFGVQPLKESGLQSDIRFERVSDDGGYVNSSMFFIHYTPAHTIEKVASN